MQMHFYKRISIKKIYSNFKYLIFRRASWVGFQLGSGTATGLVHVAWTKPLPHHWLQYIQTRKHRSGVPRKNHEKQTRRVVVQARYQIPTSQGLHNLSTGFPNHLFVTWKVSCFFVVGAINYNTKFNISARAWLIWWLEAWSSNWPRKFTPLKLPISRTPSTLRKLAPDRE